MDGYIGSDTILLCLSFTCTIMHDIYVYELNNKLHARTERSEEIKFHNGKWRKVNEETIGALLFATPEQVQNILQQIVQ